MGSSELRSRQTGRKDDVPHDTREHKTSEELSGPDGNESFRPEKKENKTYGRTPDGTSAFRTLSIEKTLFFGPLG